MAEKKTKKRKTAKKKKISKKKTRTRKPVKKRKVTRKKTYRTRAAPKPTPVTINMPAPSEQQTGMNKLMLENFVSLQRVLTNLSTKMENLTTQISNLLDLFEISAKSLADREFEIEKDNKETLEKLNVLLDQNKILARGLSLMHERMPMEQFPHPTQQNISSQPPQQNFQQFSQPQSTLTRELTPSPPPFQQPPINFGSPTTGYYTQRIPMAKELDSPQNTPRPTNQNIQKTQENNFDLEDEPLPSIGDEMNDFSEIPNPEDLDLESPTR